MRSLLLSLLMLAVPAGGQLLPRTWSDIPVYEWGGLNLLNDSSRIGFDAQVAKNVLTDSGFLESRPGNVLLATILAGYPVVYVGDWVSPSGTRYLLAHSSTTLYQTDFSGAVVALSTVPSGYNLSMVPAFSRAYFGDGSQPMWYWDGTSTGSMTGAPHCTYLAHKDGRIYCGNIPNESTSRVRISSEGGAAYWTVPSNVASVDNAPNYFDFFPDDGDSITCMASTPWGVFVGKRYSSHMIKGYGNLTYELRIIDPRVGCADNRSVQMVSGVLQWLALDGVYAFTGAGPPILISRELDPLMKRVRQATYTEGQWATQTKSEWDLGTDVPDGSWTATVANGMFPSSFTLHDDNSNPILDSSVGFSSATLVNIDSTTYPMPDGHVEMLPSEGDLTVWISTFEGGAYSTLVTSWTMPSGVPLAAPPVGSGYFPGFWARGAQGDVATTLYTIANSSGSTPGDYKWNYGAWKIIWNKYRYSGSDGYYHHGDCVTDADTAGECLNFEFVMDDCQSANRKAYGIKVSQNSAHTTTTRTYDLDIYKKSAGVTTTLGSGSFISGRHATDQSTWDPSHLQRSTITVIASKGGELRVYSSTSLVAFANDADLDDTVSRCSMLVFLPHADANNETDGGVEHVSLNFSSAAAIVSRVFDTGMSTPVAGVLSTTYTLQGLTGETAMAFYVRSATSSSGVWTAWSASSNGVTASLPKRYWQYLAKFSTNVSSYTPKLDSVQLVGITTGYYNSKVNYIGTGITSWRQFAANGVSPGTYAYDVRSGTFAFAATDSYPSWTDQTLNQNVAAATGTYAQFRIDSTALTSSANTDPLTALFVRWSEGNNIPAASATLDRRYLLCVTISTSASVPDKCLLRQKNGKWVEWSSVSSMSAVGLYNNNIIVADGGTSGKVWKILQPSVIDDAGSAIGAEWVSADHTGGLPFNDKVLHEMWVDAAPVQGSSVTASYQVNKSSGFIDHQFSLDNGGLVDTSIYPYDRVQYGNIQKWVPLASGFDVGKHVRVKFSNAGVNNYWRINGYVLYVENQARAVP